MPSRFRLGQLLVREGHVSPKELSAALSQQDAGSNLRLGRLLIELGAIDEITLAKALAQQFGLPVTDLQCDPPTPVVLATLTAEVALKLQALPLRREDGVLLVAVPGPPSPGTRDVLARSTGEVVRYVIAPADRLAHALELWYTTPGTPGRTADDLILEREQAEAHTVCDRSTTAPPGKTAQPATNSRIRDESSSSPSTRATLPTESGPDFVVNWLLSEAVRHDATAVHVEGDGNGVLVQYRVDDLLREPLHLPAAAGSTLIRRLLLAARLDPAVTTPQSGAFRSDGSAFAREVHVSGTRTLRGRKVVVQLDAVDEARSGLHALGLDDDTISTVRDAVQAQRGLIAVAGPPRSGRSRTWQALSAEADPSRRSVVTIEDPPGPLLPHVTQLRLDARAGLPSLAAFHTALDLDPDLIVIDAPVNASLLRAATQAALNNRLVLVVLDECDAQCALVRIAEAVDPFLAAVAVTLVLAQRPDHELETLLVSDTVRENLMRVMTPARKGSETHDGEAEMVR